MLDIEKHQGSHLALVSAAHDVFLVVYILWEILFLSDLTN